MHGNVKHHRDPSEIATVELLYDRHHWEPTL